MWLWLAFPWWLSDAGKIFMYMLTIGKMVSFGKMSLDFLCSIFSQIFFFWNNMSSLHFGDISPLSDIWFANILFSMLIFFHFWFCCWFPLLYWSFLVSGSFTCLFSFVLPLPKIWCQILRKKLLPKPMSRNLPLCFILGIYGSGLTFTSIKFEFIFLCGVR